MTYVPMADAAFAANIPPGFQVAAGYYGGPLAYHVWPASDWGRFPGYRLPIWVAGYDGAGEGQQAYGALRALGVPEGAFTVLDMERRIDRTYVDSFGAQLNAAGFKTWVYGSLSTVFYNPGLDGYWPAHFGITEQQAAALLGPAGDHIRAVQYAAYPGYDASLVKQWAEGEMWHG